MYVLYHIGYTNDMIMQQNRPATNEEEAYTMVTTLSTNLTRDEAFALVKQYNQEEFHIVHALTLERLMRYFAAIHDKDNIEFWGQVGLLHDMDWEICDGDEDHTLCTERILRQHDVPDALIRAIQTHNSDCNTELPKPELKMERVLFAIDETSGLIDACARLRPSKSCQDLPLSSLKKKFKNKKFAAGCGREQMTLGAEYNNCDVETMLAATLAACKATDPSRELWLAENPAWLVENPDERDGALLEIASKL